MEANSGLSAGFLLTLLAPHINDPAPLMLALGLPMPTQATSKGGFVKMMTKPCKPENHIGFGKKKPIGFEGSLESENEQTLSCVGFANSPPSFPPTAEPQTSASKSQSANMNIMNGNKAGHSAHARETSCIVRPADTAIAQFHPVPAIGTAGGKHAAPARDDYVREHDATRPANQWCEELGEWMPLNGPVKASQRALASETAFAALHVMGKL